DIRQLTFIHCREISDQGARVCIFIDYLTIRNLSYQHTQSFNKQGLIIHQSNFHHTHHTAILGNTIINLVPLPNEELNFDLPSNNSTRLLILDTPIPLPFTFSKPSPLSFNRKLRK